MKIRVKVPAHSVVRRPSQWMLGLRKDNNPQSTRAPKEAEEVATRREKVLNWSAEVVERHLYPPMMLPLVTLGIWSLLMIPMNVDEARFTLVCTGLTSVYIGA
jgi:hypothetical protein